MPRRALSVLLAMLGLAACTGHPRPKMASITEIPAIQMRATDHPGADLHAAAAETRRALLSLEARRTPSGICDLPEFADAKPEPGAPLRYLILSGGSLNGAFGAGFFLGLAEVGKLPPEATVVTGVSTGALQSTFLFLGSSHKPPTDRTYKWVGGRAATESPDDDPLRPALHAGRSNYEDLALAYTIRREGDILSVAPFGGVGMLLEGSKGRLDPLGERLLDLISPQTIRDVAFEACRGRKLYVGVADVDDGQAYALDLTRLALKAFEPGAPEWQKRHMLSVRKAYVAALIASSSVPVGAQPVTLILRSDNAKPGEERFRHLFVDGGARFGAFLEDARVDSVAHRMASDEYGVTLLVNTRLTIPAWRENDDKLKPKRGWLLSTLGLRTVDILENQVYRLSVEAVEDKAYDLGGLHMAFLHNQNLHPGGKDDGTELPDDHVYQGSSCATWHDKNHADLHPAQFYPDYMACLIDYGRQRGQANLWNSIKVK